MTDRGFGFVSLDAGGPDAFIAPDRVGAALHGDRVSIRIAPTPKGPEGWIVEVLERGNTQLTGVVQSRGRGFVFIPDDQRLRSPMRVEGNVPRRMQRDTTVLAQIAVFPQNNDDRGTVELLEVLGQPGVVEIEVAKIKIRENVVEDFPEAVQAEAEAMGSRVTQKQSQRRTDLRKVDLITIDPASAKDHDDALHVSRTKGGGYKVLVAIADVSHYVRPGTAIDAEALARGTSIYLPDRAIPMLPHALSSHLASLVPHKDRLCMAVQIELSPQGAVRNHRFMEGVMKSGGKLTYEGVARALSLTDKGPKQPAAEQRKRSLKALLEASRLLRDRRLKRGALDFDLPEAKIIMDARTQTPTAIEQAKNDPGVRDAYRMVEEMMLLANEVVARALTKRGIPAIYRAHGKPDPEKIEVFCKLAQSLGHKLDVESATNPKQLSRFLQRTEGTEHASMLRYMLLRSMQQAVYDTDPAIGHFGLAATDYLHFTSPIRRYPDLVVHRVVRSLIRGEAIDVAVAKPKMQRAAVEASRLERRAMTVERDVSDLYRVLFMQDRVGDTFDAKVSGFSQRGMYVSVQEPFVDMMLPLEQLDDIYRPDDLGIRLIGQRHANVFTLGDKVSVRLEEAHIGNRELVASLLDHAPTKKKAKPAKQKKSTRKQQHRSRHPQSRRNKKRGRRR